MNWRGGMVLVLAGILLGMLVGCKPPPPPPRDYTLLSPYPAVRTFAVAPIINLSGSSDFDSLTVADTLYTELGQVGQLNVLPVNKTLAAMNRLGIRGIDSVEAAQRIAEVLGADALVIGTITEYDPYNPPVIGMRLQLYSSRNLNMADEPEARTIGGQMLASEAGELKTAKGPQPIADVSAVFPATNQTTLLELQDFAKGRTDYSSALQERRYLADIDSYTRFVCHAMVRRLIEREAYRVSGR